MPRKRGSAEEAKARPSKQLQNDYASAEILCAIAGKLAHSTSDQVFKKECEDTVVAARLRQAASVEGTEM